MEADARAAGRRAAEAKLWAYGVSYGTVTGSTFAAMFPERVGRMVLDGVVNAEEYYSNGWRQNVEQMDEGMVEFARLCHGAGKGRCAFWEAAPGEIMRRIGRVMERITEHPVCVFAACSLADGLHAWGVSHHADITTRALPTSDNLLTSSLQLPITGLPSALPALATISDLKAVFLNALYAPIRLFPFMADALSQLERGNATSLAGQFASLNSTFDARLAIMCADSHRKNNLTSLDAYRKYVEYTVGKSKYVGDLWPIYQDPTLCRSMDVTLPDSMMVGGMYASIPACSIAPGGRLISTTYACRRSDRSTRPSDCVSHPLRQQHNRPRYAADLVSPPSSGHFSASASPSKQFSSSGSTIC